eukprot:UN10775
MIIRGTNGFMIRCDLGQLTETQTCVARGCPANTITEAKLRKRIGVPRFSAWTVYSVTVCCRGARFYNCDM